MIVGERFNGYSHLAGLVLALLGCAALLLRTWPEGDPAKTVAALVFGLSMVALYAASTMFHSSRGRTRRWWQRADHSAIYLLIAGSYTPFALVTLQGPVGWALLSAVWTAALIGMVREWRTGSIDRPCLWLYVGMGWLGVLAAVPLAARLGPGGLLWLLAGAFFYTAGTFFYRNCWGLRHAHGTWHLFVLAGSASHYVAVARFVL